MSLHAILMWLVRSMHLFYYFDIIHLYQLFNLYNIQRFKHKINKCIYYQIKANQKLSVKCKSLNFFQINKILKRSLM